MNLRASPEELQASKPASRTRAGYPKRPERSGGRRAHLLTIFAGAKKVVSAPGKMSEKQILPSQNHTPKTTGARRGRYLNFRKRYF